MVTPGTDDGTQTGCPRRGPAYPHPPHALLGTNATPARQPSTRRENVSALGLRHVLTPGTLFNPCSATTSLGASRWWNRREMAERAHRLPAESLSLIQVVMCQPRA